MKYFERIKSVFVTANKRLQIFYLLLLVVGLTGIFYIGKVTTGVDNGNPENFNVTSKDIITEPFLKEIENISLENYWFGLSYVNSAHDKISSLKVQRLRTWFRNIEDEEISPSALIVVGRKQAPHGITGFELYFPDGEDYGWRFDKQSDKSTGEYDIFFFQGEGYPQEGNVTIFTVKIYPCGDKFCSELRK